MAQSPTFDLHSCFSVHPKDKTTDENNRISEVSFTSIVCRSISLVRVEVSHNLVRAAQRLLFNALIAGTPGPTVKFPGAYKIEDPKIHIPDDIELPYDKDKGLLWKTGFLNYTAPGPKIWLG